jgi:hypothetical protein
MISLRKKSDMATLAQVKNDVSQLPKADQAVLFDWLTDVLEGELELTDEFRSEITQGKADIASGRFQVRSPR